VQERISVRQVADWNVRLTRKDTGKKDEEGNPVYAITAISWTAKKGAEIKPHFFGDFYIRIQNPVAPQQLCFPTLQYYESERATRAKTKKRKRARPEIVSWTGPPTAEFPASCVSVVAGP
jgi:hypothetical protein